LVYHYSEELEKDLELLRKQKYHLKTEEEFSNQSEKSNITNEYWKVIQGHPNPYDKEFYDYVKAHKNIKFSSHPEIARKEMKEVRYKMYADPMHEDIKTLPCEKSTGRLLLELFFGLLENL